MRCPTFRLLVPAVALAVVFGVAPLSSSAGAQAGAPAGLTLRYSDSQGPGCLTIAALGDDATAGGAAIGVSLTQNGSDWTGQGEEWLVSASAPRTSAIAFWLSDGNGNALFFDGTLRMGVDTENAQGRWTSLADPTLTDQWQAIALFPARPCTGT